LEGAVRIKQLRADRHGDETLLPIIIFCATFVGVGALVISLMPVPDMGGNMSVSEGYTIIGSTEYLLYEPFYGYNITAGNVSSTYADRETFLFTNDTISGDEREFYAIRDYEPTLDADQFAAGEDYVVVQVYWGPWYNSHWSSVKIAYATIAANQIAGTNQSVTPFSVTGWENEALIVTTAGNSTSFLDLFWADTYNVMMGQYDVIDDLASTTMWGIIRQLLTASLPDVHPVINFMIAIPFWACIGFMVFTIVSRMIPWIAGG
jgi:hypothetical protein